MQMYCAIQVLNDGTMIRVTQDERHRSKPQVLGNVHDIQKIPIEDLGGYPIKKVQEEYAKARDKNGNKLPGSLPDYVMGFPDPEEPQEFPAGSIELVPVRPLPATQPLATHMSCIHSIVLADVCTIMTMRTLRQHADFDFGGYGAL